MRLLNNISICCFTSNQKTLITAVKDGDTFKSTE